jgi:hypothetical protein
MEISLPVLDEEILQVARYVYKTRLSQPYTEVGSSWDYNYRRPEATNARGDGHNLQRFITIDTKQLHRPIHGLAHTMRTLMYSQLMHCVSTMQKKPFVCKDGRTIADLSPLDLKKLNIAQLFFVAGRESEASYGEAYHRYHLNGAKQFAACARKYLTHLFTEQEIQLYSRCIEDRAGDSFDQTPEGYLIHLSHMIDLMRCKSPVEVFMGHSADSLGIVPCLINIFGKEAGLGIMHYARGLFAATGEALPYIDSTEWPSLGVTAIKAEQALRIVGEIHSEGCEADSSKTAQAGFSVAGCYSALTTVDAPKWFQQSQSSKESAQASAASSAPEVVMRPAAQVEPTRQGFNVKFSEATPEAKPPTVKMFKGTPVRLEEIPFEETRSQLVDIYLNSVENCVNNRDYNPLGNPQQLATHYIFLKSLANAEVNVQKRQKIAALASALEIYLAEKESPLLASVNQVYVQNSEYPIINWLKKNPVYSGFIIDLIQNHHKDPFTKNQKDAINAFKGSSTFLFPNQLYIPWVAHSFDRDSRFQPVGGSRNATSFYHADLADNLLLRMTPKTVDLLPEQYFSMAKAEIDRSLRVDTMRGAELFRIQGRTLLFSRNNNHIIAVKIQKKGEPKDRLEEEYRVAEYLLKNQRRLGLESDIPHPLGQYSAGKAALLSLCKDQPNYDTLLELIDDSDNLEVYVYEAPLSYFTYLHDEHQSIEELALAVKRNTHDLFILLREGIVFPQLADIFHTRVDSGSRQDRGRYYALVQLLSLLQFDLGRIDKWEEAVKFVNLRGSGIADLGDSIPLTSLLTRSEFATRYFSELLTGGFHPTFLDKQTGVASSFFTNKRKLFGNYLYLNTIAEYLLVIQLTLGSYGDKATRGMVKDEEKAVVWRTLAELMFSSCAKAISIMTDMPEHRALTLLRQRASLDKHFMQTRFWMTPDYAKLDEASMQIEQYGMYSGEPGYVVPDPLVPGVGLSVDKTHQDLGGYNRELPLRELEKLLYATVTLVEGVMQLDKEFFKQVRHVEEQIKSNAEADTCFREAAKLLDIARPDCHFQLRLALSYYDEIQHKYPNAPSEAYHERFQHVKRQDVAIAMQRFWRQTHKEIADEHGVVDSSPAKPPKG